MPDARVNVVTVGAGLPAHAVRGASRSADVAARDRLPIFLCAFFNKACVAALMLLVVARERGVEENEQIDIMQLLEYKNLGPGIMF